MAATRLRLRLLLAVTAIIIAAVAFGYRWLNRPAELPEGFASGNGRIEATEVDIATKLAGRLAEVFVWEGDTVEPGQVVARMDMEDLQAQLRQAEAQLRQAVEGGRYAEAVVAQRESELSFARSELNRTRRLSKDGHVSQEDLDRAVTSQKTAEAALQAARVQVVEAEAAVEAAAAGVARIQSNLTDSELKSPIKGRVLYRLAEPGEVLAAGGKVLTIIDLTDVYMTLFLPTEQAGRIGIGAEARIVLDAAPEYVIPAEVSFVAARAQFTPKEVETRTEREKLMFRVKVRIDPVLLREHITRVKTGLPGVAYVRLDDQASWPAGLQVTLPHDPNG